MRLRHVVCESSHYKAMTILYSHGEERPQKKYTSSLIRDRDNLHLIVILYSTK